MKKGETVYEAADRLRLKYPRTDDLVLAMGRYMRAHARTVKNPVRPRSIIESRFMPAAEAFRKGILSCGSMSNIATAMLRHLGFKVRLIHGEEADSVDHAWIAVYDLYSDSWKEYDLAKRLDGKVLDTHIKKAEVDSWEEIRGQIEEDHKTLQHRRAEKKKG